jgi:hypothetical protein
VTPPRLSILIPTFDRAATLRDTLDSIARLEGLSGEVEVVVSDDASADHTPVVLSDYRDRLPGFRSYRQRANLGLGNWEFVLREARGELVFLLCDDDAVPAGFLREVFAAFDRHPAADLVCGDITLRGPTFEPLQLLETPTPAGELDGESRCRDQLLSHHMVMATVYRRAVLLAAGGWDRQVGTHFDCTAFCRAALRSRTTVRVPTPLLDFRISPGSWSRRMNRERQHQLALWYRRKLDLLREDAAGLAPGLVAFLGGMYVRHADTVLAGLETELTLGRVSGREARAAARALLEVFPEARRSRMAWKLWACTRLGTGWLRALRRATGRPDPHHGPGALFNSFGPP